MTNPDHELLVDALAWFIVEDETNSGSQNEESNAYWLAGRRLANSYFACQQDILDGAERHRRRMNTRSWTEADDDLPATASNHERIRHRQKVLAFAACMGSGA